MVATGFVRADHAGLLLAADALSPLLAAMAAHRPGRPITAMRADEL